jgi:hypothetical protein
MGFAIYKSAAKSTSEKKPALGGKKGKINKIKREIDQLGF